MHRSHSIDTHTNMAAMDPKLAKSLKIEDEANMINFDKVCARQ